MNVEFLFNKTICKPLVVIIIKFQMSTRSHLRCISPPGMQCQYQQYTARPHICCCSPKNSHKILKKAFVQKRISCVALEESHQRKLVLTEELALYDINGKLIGTLKKGTKLNQPKAKVLPKCKACSCYILSKSSESISSEGPPRSIKWKSTSRSHNEIPPKCKACSNRSVTSRSDQSDSSVERIKKVKCSCDSIPKNLKKELKPRMKSKMRRRRAKSCKPKQQRLNVYPSSSMGTSISDPFKCPSNCSCATNAQNFLMHFKIQKR